MLEKDIENLLADHIEEFLPKRKLALIGRQMRLGAYRADLVFQEGSKSKLIIEVKRGLLMREAIGQIGVYYGLLRQDSPEDEVKLMLVANIIPKEMAIFLKEKIGIDTLEIPISQVNQIATKYQYKFEDSSTSEQQSKNMEEMRKIKTRSINCHTWIFQANPQRFDILNALSDERLNEDVWLVSQYKGSIKSGDIGLIWMSGKDAGIYAVADVISNPELLIDSEIASQYWVSDEDKQQKRLRIKYRYKIKFPGDPILREELKNIPGLSGMAIFKQAQGTNFPVTDAEWKIISNIIEGKFSQKEFRGHNT